MREVPMSSPLPQKITTTEQKKPKLHKFEKKVKPKKVNNQSIKI